MLRDDLITLLGQRLGNRTDLDSRMQSELLMLQSVTLEETGAFTPWFLETEIATQACTAGDERLPLPTDFLAEMEEQSLWLYDVNTSPYMLEMQKDSYDVMVQRFPIAGKPRRYALTASYFLLKPTPDIVYTFKMRYYARDTALTTNIENKWLLHAPDLVLAELGAVMAKHIQNPAMEASFRADAQAARSRLYVKHEARAHNGRTYSMGED